MWPIPTLPSTKFVHAAKHTALVSSYMLYKHTAVVSSLSLSLGTLPMVIETSVVAEMAHSDDDTVSENYSDYEFVEDGIVVCALCDDGGQIVLCHGLCMRAFHATVEDGESSNCASLGLIDALLQKTFYCKNCQYNQHQCFACGELGSSDKSSHPEVFCCANLDCGYFYHPQCVAHLLHPENSIAAEDLRRRIAAGEQFECSAHRCHVCKEVEVRSARESQFAVCHRCPRAFHRRCLPREITFEVDVDMERGIYQRAWEGLIPDRLLIYCLDHAIDPMILTPARGHIKFPRIALEDFAGRVGHQQM